ncbi:MAG: trypsin-like peptidase domain-containing protein [Elusimicrobia bacterium]|nr:trypsin-like peptidase domain-containing protein [Elusimicrobiota bacterium]
MKIKHSALLLASLVPAYLLLAPGAAPVPSDLRDAVSDGAYSELSGSSSPNPAPEAPIPAPPAASGGTKSIYGDDDRLDYYAADADMRALSDSVVSLWEAKNLRTADGRTALGTVNFGQAAGLCPGQRFAEQPVGAFCSGTLVGEDIVMTAGHCVLDEAKCAATRFVFGYSLKQAGDYPRSVPAEDVYGCSGIIKRDLDMNPGFFASVFNGGPGPDFALVRLDRKVPGRKPLPIHRKARPAKGDKLFVIGHPVGLPVKVAGAAKVRDAGPKYFFKADLDTFGGNSGSAVFNADTGLIEGILVRGDVDFVNSPAGCRMASVVAQEGGKGEAVTKISVLEKFIP